jgi:DNA-binding MarR family transcriptional regulator
VTKRNQAHDGAKEDVIDLIERAIREVGAISTLYGAAVAGKIGVLPADLESLDILLTRGPLSAGELARASGLTTGAVTGLIDRLARKGFVHRVPDSADRRKVIVDVVPEAVAAVFPHYAGMREGLLTVCERYTPEQLVMIYEFLEANLAAARSELARLAQSQ